MNSEQTSHSYIYRALAYWTSISYRHARWVLLTELLITIICLVYISPLLGINPDTEVPGVFLGIVLLPTLSQ